MTNPLAGPIRHAVDDAHHSPPHMKNRDYKQLKCSITIIYLIYILFHVSRQLLLSHDTIKMLTIGTSIQPQHNRFSAITQIFFFY
jgi:hypothetical protein